VVGLFLLADAMRRGELVPRCWWGALLLGTGAFQLYDGVVQHKLLRLHQIRYHVSLWPYDLAWDVVAAVLVALGALLLATGARASKRGSVTAARPREHAE